MREIFLSVPSLFCGAAVLLNYRINDVVNSSMKPEFSTNRDSYYEGKIVHIVWAFPAFLCIAPIFIRGRWCNIISFILKWKDVSHKFKKKNPPPLFAWSLTPEITVLRVIHDPCRHEYRSQLPISQSFVPHIPQLSCQNSRCTHLCPLLQELRGGTWWKGSLASLVIMAFQSSLQSWERSLQSEASLVLASLLYLADLGRTVFAELC